MQKWGVLSPGAAVVGINLGQWRLALSESQALRQGELSLTLVIQLIYSGLTSYAVCCKPPDKMFTVCIVG